MIFLRLNYPVHHNRERAGAVISVVTKANCSFPWKSSLCVCTQWWAVRPSCAAHSRGSWKLLKELQNNQGCDFTPISPCQVMETQLQRSELAQGLRVDLGSFITAWEERLRLKKYACSFVSFSSWSISRILSKTRLLCNEQTAWKIQQFCLIFRVTLFDIELLSFLIEPGT